MLDRTNDRDVFVQKARDWPFKEVAERLGRVTKNGAEWQGPCPRCGGTDRYAVNTKKPAWLCRGCDAGGGDALSLAAHELRLDLNDGTDFLNACAWITGDPIPEFSRDGSAAPRQEEGIKDIPDFFDPKPIAVYDYHDERGKLAYQVVKFPKSAQRRYMQRRPYKGGWVWGLQEGEYGRKENDKHWWKTKDDGHYAETVKLEDAPRYLYRRSDVMAAKATGGTVALCYSPDTEILTKDGWVPFPELRPGTQVAQYSLGTGDISFVTPKAHQRFTYSGEMINIKSDWCDLLVTPDHRQPRACKVNGELCSPSIRRAEKLVAGSNLPAAGFKNDGVNISSDDIRLLVAWLADGVREPRGNKVSWNLKKDRKKERLRQLLRACGITWTEFNPPSTPGWTGFRVRKSDMDRIFALADGKRWSWDALNWSLIARLAALEEIPYWDGDRGTTAASRLFTGEKQDADVVSAIAAITGVHANVRPDCRIGRNDSYVVNLNARSWRRVAKKPARIPYNGEVFCCTVDTGILVVRRNGKVIISGNCEGEKDAETVRAFGLPATTNAGGAKYWQDSFDDDLAGCDVIIFPDNDEPGFNRAQVRAAGLKARGCNVFILDISKHWAACPPKGDVTDWKDAGLTFDQFHELLKKAEVWKPAPPKSCFGAITWDHMDDEGAQLEFLVDDMLTVGDKSILAGASGSGKTFLALDLAMAVARGTEFLGRNVQQGGVIYQAGEGSRGLKKRIRAYRQHKGMGNEDVPFVMLPSKVDLFSREGDTQKLIDEVKAWKIVMPDLKLLVIDTFSRASTGADENSGKDVGQFMDNVDRIQLECGVHVMIVHHLNANGGKVRGHTSLYADVDQVLTVTRDEGTGDRTLTLSKQKDGEDGVKIRFALAQVKLGFDQDREKDITSCVVVTVSEKDRLKKEQERMGITVNPTERKFLMDFFEAQQKHGKFVVDTRDFTPPLPFGAKGREVVEYSDYVEIALSKMLAEDDPTKAKDRLRKAFEKMTDGLRKYGVLDMQKPYMWWTGRPIKGFANTFPKNNPDAPENNPPPAYAGPDEDLDVGF